MGTTVIPVLRGAKIERLEAVDIKKQLLLIFTLPSELFSYAPKTIRTQLPMPRKL
jgi:hypothetical protein